MAYSAEDLSGAISRLNAGETDLLSEMRSLLEHCATVCPSSVWAEISELDFAGDSANLKNWLKHVLEADPPDDGIVAYWFGLFDESDANGEVFSRLYMAGCASYDPDDTAGEWAGGPTYFPTARYAESEVLRSMSLKLARAGAEVCQVGSYILPLAYASLAIAELCHSLPRNLLLGPRKSRAVAVGFDSGDFITLPAIA